MRQVVESDLLVLEGVSSHSGRIEQVRQLCLRLHETLSPSHAALGLVLYQPEPPSSDVVQAHGEN